MPRPAPNLDHRRDQVLRAARTLAESEGWTAVTMRRLAAETGFNVERATTAYYFDARFARHLTGRVEPQPMLGAVKNIVYRALPTSLREGITMVWRKVR